MKRVILEEQLPGFRSIEKHLTPVGIRRLNYRVNDIPALFCFFSLADVDNQIILEVLPVSGKRFFLTLNTSNFKRAFQNVTLF